LFSKIKEFFVSQRPLILITNDDGIDSPGLHAAATALVDLGDLLIVAPKTQRTSAGRSFLPAPDKAIYLTEIPLNAGPHPAYTADVSPAQAVQLALLELAKRPIDLCISGINYGENMGSGVTISGTVGAALEAACSGIPALAVSLETPQEYHYSHSTDIDFYVAAYFTQQFARQVLNEGLPPGVDFLKIDVPAGATPQTPWRVGRVSRQRYYQALPSGRTRLDEQKAISYRVHVNHNGLEPDSDIHILIVDRMVSVVPMTIDLTAPIPLEELAQFFNGTG
jgi:5'-nucleotidase